MNIGMIGTGSLGSILGQLFCKNLHKVMFTCKRPEGLHAFTKAVGSNAFYGSVEDVLQFADVHVIAIPFLELQNLAAQCERFTTGKVLIDTTRPCPKGKKILVDNGFINGSQNNYISHLFPNAYLAKAFDVNSYEVIKKHAFNSLLQQKLRIPFTANHPEVKQIVENLITHLGFIPEFQPISNYKAIDIAKNQKTEQQFKM
ncbi:NAD(P)-binding domain-containing protein [Aquimarina sp. U1-2]|uniref:NADPH-dependent F420 reductase n=1 Tax=Aquimarina sp. U1-2 TaxID=2823141 RepID=UPI001AECA1F0|nr:NAD(P)-binding domain-containing protein [Aquimarina sp. U1-2]MBP2833775.1 NAD(P)-binding domain-containing protein [Aquimarina sp. U1-2]